MQNECTVFFDDVNHIICTCGFMYHPEQELKHLKSAKHIKNMNEKHLTASDKKLIKKFKKLLFTPEAV